MLIGDDHDGAGLQLTSTGTGTGTGTSTGHLEASPALVDTGSMGDRQKGSIQSELDLDYWCPIPFIDLSTPESLERDFYAWLKGEEDDSQPESLTPTHRHDSTDLPRLPPIDQFIDGHMPPVAATGAAALHHCPAVKFDVGVVRKERNSISSSVRSSTCSYSPDAVTSLHSSSPITTNAALPIADEQITAPMMLECAEVPKPVATNKASRSSGTNQLGRTYSPGLPLSMEERERIVELYKVGWKICDISKTLCITHSCVSKILHRFRTTGTVKPKDAKEGRQESPLVVAIRDYQQRLGIVRQSEIREQLIKDGVCRKENAPSRSSINHILRTKLDLKRRKK